MGKERGPRTIRSKKDMDNHKLKNGDIVDYTKWRLGSTDRGKSIVKCEKCGRNGLLSLGQHTSDCHHIFRYDVRVRIKQVEGKEIREPFDIFTNLDSCYLGSRSKMGESDPNPAR